MPNRPSELDLLGLIEGDISDDRRALVERALAADPELRRRVNAMAADRQTLRGLPPIAAPAGLVQAAIDVAEREALLGPTIEHRPGVLARLGAPRRMALAAGLLFVIGGGSLAVWTGALNPRGGGAGGIATHTETTTDAPEQAGTALAMATPSDDMSVGDRARSAGPSEARTAIDAAPPVATSLHTPAREAAVAELASLDAYEPMELVPDGGIFPLMRAVRAIDDARIDWSVEGERYLTLMVAGMERTIPARRARAAPLVTPASFDDALRLASMDRLTVRICSKDPLAVERAMREFAARSLGDARMSVIGASGGSMHYTMEMDRTVPEFSAFLDAMQRPGSTQAYLDVSLLPATRTMGVAWGDTPRQVNNRGPRVRVPVVLECSAAAE